MKQKRSLGLSVLFVFVMAALLLSPLEITGCFGGQWKAFAEDGAATNPNAETVTIDLISEFPTLHLLGDGRFTRDNGRILADNANMGDTALMRTVIIEPGEHILIEVSAIIHEGAAFGVIIGEKDYTDSFKTGWFCVNADINYRGSRFFGENVSNWGGLFKDRDLAIGKETRLAMEILPDNTVRAYYDGVEYTDDTVVIEKYNGGYPGIMTYKGKVEFLSATLTYFGKEGQ